jgi:hypothetical protein
MQADLHRPAERRCGCWPTIDISFLRCCSVDDGARAIGGCRLRLVGPPAMVGAGTDGVHRATGSSTTIVNF